MALGGYWVPQARFACRKHDVVDADGQDVNGHLLPTHYLLRHEERGFIRHPRAPCQPRTRRHLKPF
eukprot:7648242-Prorocentrum_lima.AAC.1